MTYKHSVEDPLLQSLETNDESIRWMLEDYPTRFPYDKAAVEPTVAALQDYGYRLEEQLELSVLMDKVDPDCELIWMIDIAAATPTSSFHRLYWEAFERTCSENGIHILVRRIAGLWEPDMETLHIPDEQRHGAGKRGPSIRHEPSISHSQAPICPSTILEEKHPEEDSTASSVNALTNDVSLLTLTAGKKPRRPFNVLFVVSRPDKEYDINPLITIEAMGAAMESYIHNSNGECKSREDVPIQMEVSRPGTFTALEQHLESRTSAWRKSGGSGAWFDIVHFDCHGVVRDGKASLLFLSTSGKKALRKSGAVIGALLNKYDVSTAVLHACESAKVGTHEESNLAQTLIRSGVRTVIAMAFKFTSSAAKLFTRLFYRTLLTMPYLDVQMALRAARLVQMLRMERLGRFDVAVELPDGIIPILYITKSNSLALVYSTQGVNSLKDFYEEKNVDTSSYKFDLTTTTGYGRANDLLSLEWCLLRSPATNIVMITGETGIGKTTFIFLVVIPFWVSTKLIESIVYHWDLRAPDPDRVVRALQEFRSSPYTEQAKTRKLIILENVDAVTHSKGVNNAVLGADGLQQLKSAIHELEGTNTLIILCSRSIENWCDLTEAQMLPLGPLPRHYAESMVARNIQAMGKEDLWKDETQSKYLEHILGRLNYNPLSIELHLESMDWARAFWDQQGLSREQQDLKGRYPDTPELLFDMTLRDALGYDTTTPIFVELMGFMHDLIESTIEYGLLILYGLSVPSSVYRQEWHKHFADQITKRRELNPPLTGHTVDRFVDEYLLDTGWMRSFDMVFKDGTRQKYYSIHPLLTNTLRLIISTASDADTWLAMLTQAHMEFHANLCLQFNLTLDGRERLFQIQIESFSFLNAIDSFIFALELNQPPQEIRELWHTNLTVLITSLYDAALDGNSPVLEMDFVISRIERCIKYFEGRIGTGHLDRVLTDLKALGSLGHLIDLWRLLCKWHQVKKPLLAGYWADRCLQIVKICSSNFDWNKEMRFAIADALITRGTALLGYGSSTGLARQAFEMALRCYKREGDDEWDRAASARICESAYSGLYEAVRLLRLVHYHDDDPSFLDDIQSIRGVAYKEQAVMTEESSAVASITAVSNEPEGSSGNPEAMSISLEGLNPGNLVGAHSKAVISEQQNLEQASRLGHEGSELEAKTVLLDGLGDAMLAGDIFREHLIRLALIDRAEKAQDWNAAGTHIVRTSQLERRSDGGLWFAMSPPDRLVREARHAVIFLHLGRLSEALTCFDRGYEARCGIHFPEIEHLPESPGTFIDIVLDVGRYVMLHLTALDLRWITFDEYLDLDDLMQDLTIEFVHEQWPDMKDTFSEATIRHMMRRPEELEKLRRQNYDDLAREITDPSGNWKTVMMDTRQITHAGNIDWDKEKNNPGFGMTDAAAAEALRLNAVVVPRKASVSVSDSATASNGQPTTETSENSSSNTATAPSTSRHAEETSISNPPGPSSPLPPPQPSLPLPPSPPPYSRPRRARMRYVTEEPCDLEPLEPGLPLYDADPEGRMRGKLKHALPKFEVYSWVLTSEGMKMRHAKDEEDEEGGDGEGEEDGGNKGDKRREKVE